MSMLGLDPLAVVNTPATETKQTENQQQGMLSVSQPSTGSFSEGWSTLNMPNSKSFDNMDRIGGLNTQKTQAQQAMSSASNYKLDNGLSFDIYDEILDENVGKQRAAELNAFTSSPDYVKGLSSYKQSMQGKGLSDAELEMYYADAQGVRSRGSNLFYNTDKNQFDYEVKGPDYVKAIVQAGLTTALTAGVGGALAGSSLVTGIAGGNTAVAGAIGQGVASGAMTAIQGGDGGDILKSAVMGGIGGAAGESTKLLANAEHMATLSASAASSLQATSDLLNTANTVLKTVEAVDNKDILGVVQGGLQLSGLPSMGQYATDTLLENFPDSEIVTKHAASISTGILKAFDKGLQGASPDDILKSGIVSYFKDGGGLALGDFDIDLDSADFGLPESLQPIVDAFRAGIDAIDENVVTPVLDTVAEVAEGADQFVRDLPGEIEDVEGAIDAVNEPVDKLIRAIPGTKEDAQDAGDWLVDKGKDALGGLAGILLGGAAGGSGGAQQAPKDEYVDLTNITLDPSEMAKGFEYESLSNPYLRG